MVGRKNVWISPWWAAMLPTLRTTVTFWITVCAHWHFVQRSHHQIVRQKLHWTVFVVSKLSLTFLNRNWICFFSITLSIGINAGFLCHQFYHGSSHFTADVFIRFFCNRTGKELLWIKFCDSHEKIVIFVLWTHCSGGI